MEQIKSKKSLKKTNSVSNKNTITRNSHTPIRVQNSNKLNTDKNNHSLFPSQNNYNINNNISININIDMSNNNNNNKSFNIKNKSQPKKHAINLKNETKEKDPNLNNTNNTLFDTLKKFSNKSEAKSSPFHVRIKSANFDINNFKYKSQLNTKNKVYRNRLNDNKSNFNIFSHKFETKLNEDNNIKEKELLTEYVNKNKDKKVVKKINNKINNIERDKFNKTRNNFSPLIKNKKTNTPINLNHSINHRKINKNKNSINNLLQKEINNNGKKKLYPRNINFSPFTLKNSIVNKTTELDNKRKNKNIMNNNIFKSPINNKSKAIKNFNNKIDIKAPNFISPLVNNKKVSKFNKTNNMSNINNKKQNNIINKEKQIIQKELIKNKSDNKKNNKNNNKNNKKMNKMEKNENQEKQENQQIQEKQEKIEEEKINNDDKQKEIKEEKEIIKENNNINKVEESNIKPEKNDDNDNEIKPSENNLKKNEEVETNKKESKTENEINAEMFVNDIFSKSLFQISSQPEKPSSPQKKLHKVESICKKGYAGPGIKKTNQDNFFIYKNFINNPDTVFLGVCDGHGTFGHDISNYLVNNLPESVHSALIKENITSIDSEENKAKIIDIVSLSFVQTNINLVNNEKIDSSYSGSTCSSLIFSPKKIFSANLGDSRCVLAKFDGEKWSAKNLTRDHKPTEEDEKKRIIDKGGRIESYKDEDGQPVGPERVWLKGEDVPGLAMSRSFGDDVAHMIGVTSKPEILEYNLCEEDKFIMLASDGIYEFISSEEAVNMVKDFYLKDDIDGALNHLYKVSSQKWLVEEEVIDDITLIIMFLK